MDQNLIKKYPAHGTSMRPISAKLLCVRSPTSPQRPLSFPFLSREIPKLEGSALLADETRIEAVDGPGVGNVHVFLRKSF